MSGLPKSAEPGKAVVSPSTSAGDDRVFLNHPSCFSRFFAYRRLWLLGIIVFALDQLTKGWINTRLPFGSYGPGASVTVFPNFFYLVHVGNTGAAWSMFAAASLWLALLPPA